MNKQLLKTSGAEVLSPRKKLRKTLWGDAPPPPPSLYVRALSHNFILILIRKLSLRVSFFPVSLLAKSATIAPKIKRQTSYPSHMEVFHPFPPLPPPHPPNNHSWGDWVRFTSTGGGDTPYNGVYGEAPPERGIGKSIIWVCERAKELTDDFYGFIKLKKCSIFVMDSYLKDSAFTAAKRMQSVLSKVWERGTICKLKVTRKGHRKKRHIKGKGLDLGAVPPRINICWVPAPLPLLGPLPRKNFIRYKSGY